MIESVDNAYIFPFAATLYCSETGVPFASVLTVYNASVTSGFLPSLFCISKSVRAVLPSSLIVNILARFAGFGSVTLPVSSITGCDAYTVVHTPLSCCVLPLIPK